MKKGGIDQVEKFEKNIQIRPNLKAARALARLSQSEVAEKIGVKRQTIARWENGESTPTILQGVALAECYNIPVTSIDFYKENQI